MRDERPDWAVRLRAARERMFPTTWRAAQAMQKLDPKDLPDTRELHRYWSQRWEPGKIKPSRTYRELIERLLRVPGLFEGYGVPAEDDAISETGAAGGSDSGSVVAPAQAGGAARAGQFANAAHPGGLGGSGGRAHSARWAEPVSVGGEYPNRSQLWREIAMAADDAAGDAADLGVGPSERTLAQLHEDVLRTARGYAQRPLPDVFRAARQTREFAIRLARQTRRPDQLADLNVIAGQSCSLLSSGAFDMGYWDAAARFADSAVSYAELAGHASLHTYAVSMQAFMANWLGRPDEAVNRIAEVLAGAPPGVPAARLHAHQVRSYAQLGDRERAAEAARAAVQAREVDVRDEMVDDIGGEFSYVLARQVFNVGSAYVTLGDGVSAEKNAKQALDLYATLPAEQRFYYDEYAARVDLANARILRGDLAGARAALVPVFDLPPVQRSAGITSRLDQARALLAADLFHNSREAATLITDIADFTADLTPRALPPGEL